MKSVLVDGIVGLVALTITAGSLVLIAFSSGTTFSWIVYLSRIETLLFFALGASTTPVRSSLGN